MESVLERLEERQAAALVLVEELRVEALAAADRLDEARCPLSDLVIARRTVAGLAVAGQQLVAVADGVDAVVGPAVSGGGPRPGVRGAVRDEAVYARIREVFAGAGRPLRVKQVCQGLGLPEGKNATESVRAKLRRLADDGVLVRVEDGLFAPAAGAAR
ncbi:hypothetical protein OG762_49500 (plasmid) [Streptomyces sp. NBC_01136]|uniref:hypothetical protein n=1 Tax=unclassified Streptomyces TaxID=2593676 RepID=UPI002F907A44|nr:hypothetical protein OG762_49500 [Streptomyces sp. NBC_01136]